MSDSFFILAGSSLAWIAFALFLFALTFDWVRQRFTHRRRCPKCWYDLSQAPFIEQPDPQSSVPPQRSRTCPECGHTAKRERTLYKSRKRWRLASLALLLLLVGYSLRVTPAIKQRGLIAAIPTTALILLLPTNFSKDPTLGFAPPPQQSWQPSGLYAELNNRLNTQDLFSWQTWLLTYICIRGDHSTRPYSSEWHMYYSPVLNSLFSPYVPEHPALNTALQLCTVDLQLRPVQPAESPLCAKLFFTSWYGGQGRFRFEIVPGFSSAPIASGVWDRDRPGVFLYDHSDFPVWEGSLGILPLDTKSLECDIRVYCSPGVDSYDYGPERLIADIHIDKPITTAGSIHDAFPPRAIAESNLRRLFKPFLRFDEWTSTYALDLNDDFDWSENGDGSDLDSESWTKTLIDLHFEEVSLGLQVELLKDGVTVGRGTACLIPKLWRNDFMDGRLGWMFDSSTIVDWLQQPLLDPDPSSHKYEVILRGDPQIALRSFSAKKWWQGELRLPVQTPHPDSAEE